MLGAIIGDVAGSYIEVLEIEAFKEKNIRRYEDRISAMNNNLFDNNCSVTDDSILTVAIADAILNGKDYGECLKEYGLKESTELDKYGRGKFGPGFISWINGTALGNSIGNGCAMRISPIGYLFNDFNTLKEETKKATIPSHNNEDSIKCAEAISTSIYLIRNGATKDDILKYITKNYFPLDYDLEDLRLNYKFTCKAIDSVPQAIYCFLISHNFEDAIRISLSIGGDSDTIACITGSLAESYYGIPIRIIEQVKPYIKDYMFPIINEFYTKLKRDNGYGNKRHN